MLDAMTEAELDDPSLVNGAARERIAKASGKPIDQVRSLIYLHKNTRFYHLVLKMRYIEFNFLLFILCLQNSIFFW